MNLLLEEWHCTLRGPEGTEFEGGLYHFRILLPAEYPFRPPSLMMLTPNGRFELNTKVSLHPWTWVVVDVDLVSRYVSALQVVSTLLISNKGLSSFCCEDHEELWQPAWGVRTGKPFYLSLILSMKILFLQPFLDCRVSFHLEAKLRLVLDR